MNSPKYLYDKKNSGTTHTCAPKHITQSYAGNKFFFLKYRMDILNKRKGC